MAEANTGNLPDFLDSLLDFLYSKLPPHAYDIIENLLTHGYTLISSLISLVYTLISSATSSGSWDVEKIIPPLITLLAAYLALVSFYRTAGWMIRTMFAFVKWGFILTTLGTAAGYFLANANVGGAEGGNGLGALGMGGFGLLSTLGGLVSEFMNGQGSQSTSRSSRAKSPQKQSKSKTRPKAYESWDKHRQWQYNENEQNQPNNAFADAQRVIGDILGNAGRVAQESGWWDAAKDFGKKFAENSGRRQETDRKSKRKERNTKSR